MKNKTYIITGVVILFLVVLFMVTPTKNISNFRGAEFIEKYSNTEGAVLLDVRTPEEFASGHIQSAINIDFQNPSFAEDVKKLDTSKPYFVYCRSGNRSGKAVSFMKENGFTKIYELQGGIVASPELIQ